MMEPHRFDAVWADIGDPNDGVLRVLKAPVSVLGEAPLWNAAAGYLNWVDCEQRRLFKYDPSQKSIWAEKLSGNPGTYAHIEGSGTLLAYRNRLSLRTAEGERDLQADAADFSTERFNDGAVDRAGRFWVGAMDPKMRSASGGLFRIGPDLILNRVASGYIVSNGIAFSPDNRFLYHTDSRVPAIYRYDFDLASGDISNRRVFAAFESLAHRPDGCTIDSEGHLWAAIVDAGCIRRFDPDGVAVSDLMLPVTRPTSVAFGGSDFRTLFITTMQHGLSDDELSNQQHAGCLLAWECDFEGLPEPSMRIQ